KNWPKRDLLASERTRLMQDSSDPRIWNLQVKNFFQRLHGTIRQCAVGLNKKVSHLALPTIIHVPFGHSGPGAFKIFRFQIADEKSIVPQEQRVISPSSFPQSLLHFGPHISMALFVFFEPLRLYLQYKADTLHDCSLPQESL